MPTRCDNLLHRLARWLRPRVEVFYSERYNFSFSGSPLDAQRAERILTFLAGRKLVTRDNLRQPTQASLRGLLRIHSATYLEALTRPGALTRVFGAEVPDEVQDRALEAQRYAVGGTVEAVCTALATGGVCCNLAGGLHHAHAGQGTGFCIFNDIAVAVATARERGFLRPVLVVDLDLHDGDGTRSIFANDASVHTLSIHNRHWSDPEAVASTAVALGDAVDDRTYLDAVRTHLPPVIETHQPELVLYVAGCDPAFDDRLGNWKISAAGLLERDRFVFDQVRRRGRTAPMVILPAGGYGTEAWRYLARFLAFCLSGGKRIEPPSTEEIVLERFQQVARLLTPAELTGSGDWELTEEDVLAPLMTGVRETRLLGYYSRHGLELALDRVGILDRLRDLGFSRPSLEFDLAHPAGHTLRLWSAETHRELLVEARLRRDRRALEGLEVLVVEWLLMQNPRVSFCADRPALPGQRHPGLGLLRETMALLVLACERLHLDGLLFVPSHYHLGAQARKYFRCLRPEDEARWQALAAVLRHIPLAEASRAVATGLIWEARSEESFHWPAMPMVLPVSDAMRQRLDCADYRRRVEEAGSELELVLRPPADAAG